MNVMGYFFRISKEEVEKEKDITFFSRVEILWRKYRLLFHFHNSSINDYDEGRIICGIGIFVLLTILSTFIIVTLTFKGYFFYSMCFKPGIYIFTAEGDYYYYPSDSLVSNTTLIILGGGYIDVNNFPYLNITTVQPGYYSILVTPITSVTNFNKDLINTLPMGLLLSLVVVMLLCRLELRLEKKSRT
jgi:hypothetical protein